LRDRDVLRVGIRQSMPSFNEIDNLRGCCALKVRLGRAGSEAEF
jgi:hypothetical protein